MKLLVVNKITQKIKTCRSCSIISDGTQDESKLEAVCVIVRYVEENQSGSVRPVERVIDIFTTGDTSGETLCDRIVSILTAADINLDFVIGQSYDGASNMRGKNSGVRTRMCQHAPRALYVWCHAHRLNLVVESMLCCCTDFRKAIGLMQELYNFFNGHRRHAVFVDQQASSSRRRALKRVADTTRSWRSVEDGVLTFLDCYDVLEESLERLEVESTESATVRGANGLLSQIGDFRIIVCLHILKCIFAITGPASRILQGIAIDLSTAVTLVRNCVDKLKTMTENADTEWQLILDEAKAFASNHGIEPIFTEKRKTRMKRMPGEMVRDERIQDAEKKMKVDVFKCAIDNVYTQLVERFQAEDFEILNGLRFFSPAYLLSASASCKPTEEQLQVVCRFYNVNPSTVLGELKEFRQIYNQLQLNIDMDDVLHLAAATRITTAHPNSSGNQQLAGEDIEVEGSEGTLADDSDDTSDRDVADFNADENQTETCKEREAWIHHGFLKPYRLLCQLSGFMSLKYFYKILVTLPVSSCSAERAMSRIRIVKNRLRSTMMDDWLSALLCVSTEKDILEQVAVDDIINKFAECSEAVRRQLV